MNEERAPRPSEAYARGVASGRWQFDSGQERLLPELDRVQRALLAVADGGWFARLRSRFGRPAPIRGLYLWGAVGRGKTLLMDLLYDSLPMIGKRRQHFHRFMGELHRELRQRRGQAEPLAAIASAWAAESRLICLDEFLVADIGDAMILGEFLRQLFNAGGVLVTTSNAEPAALYRDGLQRARFLPAIALIEHHCVVRELIAAGDYRLRTLQSAHTWHSPSGAAADALLADCFARLTASASCRESELLVLDRSIPVRCWSDGVAWFDFASLCLGPRAAADYLELARDFNTLLISGVPRFDDSNRLEDAALRFIHLVDTCYDHRVNLIISADAKPNELYGGRRHRAEFARTESRLIEMQSADYQGQAHLG